MAIAMAWSLQGPAYWRRSLVVIYRHRSWHDNQFMNSGESELGCLEDGVARIERDMTGCEVAISEVSKRINSLLIANWDGGCRTRKLYSAIRKRCVLYGTMYNRNYWILTSPIRLSIVYFVKQQIKSLHENLVSRPVETPNNLHTRQSVGLSERDTSMGLTWVAVGKREPVRRVEKRLLRVLISVDDEGQVPTGSPVSSESHLAELRYSSLLGPVSRILPVDSSGNRRTSVASCTRTTRHW